MDEMKCSMHRQKIFLFIIPRPSDETAGWLRM